jgi:hypothetical protein
VRIGEETFDPLHEKARIYPADMIYFGLYTTNMMLSSKSKRKCTQNFEPFLLISSGNVLPS